MAKKLSNTAPASLENIRNAGTRIYRKEDKVFVEKPELLDEIIDSIDSYASSSNCKSRYSRTYTESTSKSLSSSQKPDEKLIPFNNIKSNQTIQSNNNNDTNTRTSETTMKEMIKARVESQKAKDEAKFEKLLNNVNKSIDTLREVNQTLSSYDYTQQHKYQRQFEEWNVGIHGSIQKQITQKLNSMDSKTLHETKYNDYSKFLDVTNRKANIYRDIIIESEYDPLEPNRRAIKVKLDKSLRDPTHLDQQKLEEERGMLNPGYKKPKQPLGKTTLSPELWAADKIASTSFGFSSKSNKVNRSKAIDELNSTIASNSTHNTFKSSVIFDHYTYPTNNQGVDEEMPKGKRSIRVHDTLVID